MSEYLSPLRLTASLPLSVMQFVTIDGNAGDWLCRPSSATTDLPIGVTGVAYDAPPGLAAALGATGSTPVAASAGEQIQILHSGDVCPVVLGGTVTAGQLVGCNGSTSIVAITAGSGNYYGGVALQGGTTGACIDILTHFGKA